MDLFKDADVMDMTIRHVVLEDRIERIMLWPGRDANRIMEVMRVRIEE